MAVLINKLSTKKDRFLADSVKIGIVIGLVTGVGWNLVSFSVMKEGYDVLGSVADGLFRIIEFSLASLVIGLIMKNKVSS